MKKVQDRAGQRRRRIIRWDRIFIMLIILLVVAVALAGATVYAYLNMARVSPAVQVAKSKESPPEKLTNRVNILLLGVDDQDKEIPGDTSRRSDTMMVASISPEDGTINLLSLPRDTMVAIPGRKGYDKINHAYAYGGVQLAKSTVEQFLQVPINYYVVIDWQAFIRVIDILGGVNLYVEQDMKYRDPYADLDINIAQGYQHLDGEKAGQYVRFRHDELGDIGRVQRQQRFLKELANETMQVSTIFKVPALVNTIDQYVETDMSAMTMIKVGNSLKSFNSNNLVAEMLPGDFATIDELSYWIPNKEQTQQLVQAMFLSASKVKGVGNNVSANIK
ncbi:Transcriptional regulator LytR [Sporomusa ovata DSM 2662]|uniref:Cell envelope-associated transcriptional attenuator LytR-CpsA-Psr, subfamily M (As in PMID19099556) n=1 Tax=Sporomusa ovata TaxID=2378 RepID=A0A0U1L0V5_9FIRM|nr:LCP family protein [Sporomusa ovata]EQB29112.1 transcriptional attenuator, LytR family [Sporomusa ovata DSM 2662]CQR72544.1 Cell envelope-associated transcriptional attenuator LytR-CpsA-Psr, subfamily M (as in PMID19099556) [Sporomusa ovata]